MGVTSPARASSPSMMIANLVCDGCDLALFESLASLDDSDRCLWCVCVCETSPCTRASPNLDDSEPCLWWVWPRPPQEPRHPWCNRSFKNCWVSQTPSPETLLRDSQTKLNWILKPVSLSHTQQFDTCSFAMPNTRIQAGTRKKQPQRSEAVNLEYAQPNSRCKHLLGSFKIHSLQLLQSPEAANLGTWLQLLWRPDAGYSCSLLRICFAAFPFLLSLRAWSLDCLICGGVLVENVSDDFPQQIKKIENIFPNFPGSSPTISPKTSPTSLWKSLVLSYFAVKGCLYKVVFSDFHRDSLIDRMFSKILGRLPSTFWPGQSADVCGVFSLCAFWTFVGESPGGLFWAFSFRPKWGEKIPWLNPTPQRLVGAFFRKFLRKFGGNLTGFFGPTKNRVLNILGKCQSIFQKMS